MKEVVHDQQVFFKKIFGVLQSPACRHMVGFLHEFDTERQGACKASVDLAYTHLGPCYAPENGRKRQGHRWQELVKKE